VKASFPRFEESGTKGRSKLTSRRVARGAREEEANGNTGKMTRTEEEVS
jgi:hypothetical protein